MPLMFDDRRRQLRQLPHLMPPRPGVVPAQSLATTPIALRIENDDPFGLLGRDERPLVLEMPGGPARLNFGNIAARELSADNEG